MKKIKLNEKIEIDAMENRMMTKETEKKNCQFNVKIGEKCEPICMSML